MKEEWAIKISTLIDGELSEQESSDLIDAIQRNEELREVWVRYQAASNLMRSEASCIAPSQFSDKVSRSLRAEPTILSPRQRPKIVFDKTTVGAIAASVFVFAVMIGGSPEESVTPFIEAPINIASTIPALPERNLTENVVRLAGNGVKEEVWIQDERLNELLMKHSEKTRSAGVFGVLPFARVVNYGNGR
jgi:hypothetical protein